MRKRANPLLGVLIMPLFLIVGVFVTKWGAKTLDNAKESMDWPTVQGQVLHSEVVREKKSNSGSRSSGGSSVTYNADVMFEFKLKGDTYSSDNVSFGQYSSSDPSEARKIVRDYPQGSSVTVYYNPEDPDVSVLEPGVTWSSYIIWGMGLLFSGIGVLGFLGCLFSVLRNGL